MRTVIFSRIFALDVDAKPTLTFEARNTREAQQLCKEPWLRADLNSLKSNGVLLPQNFRCDLQPIKKPVFSVMGALRQRGQLYQKAPRFRARDTGMPTLHRIAGHRGGDVFHFVSKSDARWRQ
jgi:hypothetical protein